MNFDLVTVGGGLIDFIRPDLNQSSALHTTAV